jgi:hypothetical protein
VRLLAALPYHLGCSVDARGCHFSEEAVKTLLNETPEAVQAVKAAEEEERISAEACAAFENSQAELVSRWADECDDDPVDTIDSDGECFNEMQSGCAGKNGHKKRSSKDDSKKTKLLVKQRLRRKLAREAQHIHDRSTGDDFTWRSQGRPPMHCGSGHLIAQLSYYSKADKVRKFEDFGLESCWGKAWMNGRINCDHRPTESTSMKLHEAADAGFVEIVACSGRGYGREALSLTLRNTCDAPLDIIVPAGIVFEQIRWNHHHNLLVRMSTHIRLERQENRAQKLGAYSMNQNCISPSDDPMRLTSFLIKDKAVLKSQGHVWSHFNGVIFPESQGPHSLNKKGSSPRKKSAASMAVQGSAGRAD